MTRVLIVDDKEENLYYLQSLLTGHGCAVDSARHGAEALVKARQRPPDLIISDLLMPVMDGYTLLRHWKADARLKAIPFIVYTATYTEPEDERLALSLGADAFILKPSEPEAFLARIRDVQNRSALPASPPPNKPPVEETELYKGYSETLIRKLEEKMLLLEAANQALEQDIAERKLMEEKLRSGKENQRRLAETQMAILNALPAHIALIDSTGLILSVNESWRRFATANQLQGPEYGIGQNYLKICESTPHDSTREAHDAACGIRRVLGGELMKFTLEYPCHSLTEQRWFRLMVTPLHDDGHLGAVVMHLDITERQLALHSVRESEERFRELAETIQEVFWITDPARTRMLYISPAYEKIWGRSCASLYESPRTWLAAIHPDDREQIQHATATRQTNGDYDETYRIRRPDGTLRWIHDRAFPVHDATGGVVRIVGTAEDITVRRQLEEQFRQSQKMEAIGQLAAGVAHDFNNILGAILGNTQLALADTTENHPVRESLEEIKKASLRATSLVQQILAFSRQQSQERRVIELGPTIQEAVKFLRATIPSVVELVILIDAAAPPILADPTQMHQVITNLCTNAWHALDDRPGRIDIKLQLVTLDAIAANRLIGLKPGPFACLSVTDTGKGMDAATLERIFDPFFTTKEPGRGTGLGLSVVHGIVEGHDGTISVTSTPGGGTTFQIYLPAAAAQLVAGDTSEPASRRGDGRHVLYLDDESSLVLLATRMLERLGYRVTGFIRAADAVKAFRENPDQFDLVITDLNMPGTSGLNVATELLALRPDMPVVLSSGHVTEDLKQRARKAGIRDVLYKPNTMEELSETIHQFAAKPGNPGSG